MINRPLYIRKLKSSRLKEFNYNININFDESKELKEIIGLSDNQILRTIRDIRKRTINRDKIELLIRERDLLKKKHIKPLSKKRIEQLELLKKKLNFITGETAINSDIYNRLKNKCKNINKDNLERIIFLQNKINNTMFIEDYISVVIEHKAHYDYMYKNGFVVNGKTYRRFSCSAGQARVSTVVFVNEEIIEELKKRLNNGRNLNEKFSPSKFNAYFGLAGSATKIVTEPRFIVVKDYENTDTFMANYVIENGWKHDDTVIQKEVTMKMNRTDGMGLIKKEMADIWAKDLGLDYTPAQFCIRNNFIKGMLCVFDIEEFCKEKNNGNYIVNTIYKDADGNYIKADLRNVDVILTESQFKLWDSFNSIDEYITNCKKNNLKWGVAVTSPKKAKNILKLNYQFIQTLNLNEKDIEKLASQFIDWITGVSYDNVPYMLLFLLGVNNDEEKIRKFISNSENYWIKALIVNNDLKNDKYIRSKIRELLRKKINNACMGDIYVDGNFQVLVSDPYGFMQHVCGLEVTGLLKKNEFYSNYWNERNIKQVDAMRSPLTYLSEHVLLNLRNDEETRKWYKYCDLGIIINYHGHEVVNFGGADFDMDILATTSNDIIKNGVYKNELPVVYNVPTPKKILFTEDDLYLADTFSFGSIIGSITNKSSNGYALLPNILKKYGENDIRYKLLKSRLQQCCKAQSAQIDKAKIGREVKGIPSIWINKKKIKRKKSKNAIDKKYNIKSIYNAILLNKHPYFFRYLYNDTNRLYKAYVEQNNITCHQKFKMSIEDLQSLKRKTIEQIKFLENYYEYMPVTMSDSSMNLLCKYIESINFNINQKIKEDSEKDIYQLYKNYEIPDYSNDDYIKIINEYKTFIKCKRFELANQDEDEENETTKYNADKVCEYKIDNDSLENRLRKINSDIYIIVNCLVDYFYINNTKANKDILWTTFGKYLYENVKKNTKSNTIMFPFPDVSGDIKYLGEVYKLKEVEI